MAQIALTTSMLARSLSPPMLYVSPGLPARKHYAQCLAVVLYEDPVADIAAVAINRQRLRAHRVE